MQGRTWSMILLLGSLIWLTAACAGGDGDDEAAPAEAESTETPVPGGDEQSPTAASEPTADASSGDQAGGPDLPDTPVRFPLRTAFSYSATTFDSRELSDMPEGLQDVTAHWYRGGGFLIIVYRGLDLDVTGPVCPGNSLSDRDTGRFEHISNSPTAPGACDGDSTLAIAPAESGVRICDGVVSYITLIPEDADGFINATVNAYPEGEDGLGVTFNILLERELPEVEPAILAC